MLISTTVTIIVYCLLGNHIFAVKSQDLWGVLKLMLAEDRVRPSAAALLESPIVHQHRQARQQQLARDRVMYVIYIHTSRGLYLRTALS